MTGVLSRRGLLNLVMLLVVTALGALAWWWTQNRDNDGPQGLLALKLADIDQIEIDRAPTHPGRDVLAFRKVGEGWDMILPQRVEANPARIRHLLTLLEEPVAASYPAADRDLGQYGLKPGMIGLRFNKEYLLLGDLNPVSQRRYVLHGGRISLVSETVFGGLGGAWTDFVSMQLTPTGEELTAVDLPDGKSASADVLGGWRIASALRVEPLRADSTASGPVVRLRMGDKVRELHILSRQDELILADFQAGLRYVLPASQAELLLPEP